MKALTIDALWAWAIIHGPKRIENRTWRTNYRGPLAIHAGRTCSRDDEAFKFLTQQGLKPPTGDDLERMRGHVLGIVELVDCVELADIREGLFSCDTDAQDIASDAFSEGPMCWVIENPRPLRSPLAAPGKPGLWDIDIDVQSCF